MPILPSVYDDSGSSLTLEQTELEVVTNIHQGHQAMMTVLANRHRNLQVVHNLWQNKDAKVKRFAICFCRCCIQPFYCTVSFQMAVETAINMNDPAIIVDLLSVIIFRP